MYSFVSNSAVCNAGVVVEVLLKANLYHFITAFRWFPWITWLSTSSPLYAHIIFAPPKCCNFIYWFECGWLLYILFCSSVSVVTAITRKYIIFSFE